MRIEPEDRGHTYIDVMHDLAQTRQDPHLHAHHTEELDQLIRPLATMNPHELNQLLEGIHHALHALLEELIPQPR